MWLRCLACGAANVLLIRGMCRACAPEIHGAYEADMTAYAEARRLFMIETERDPLRDWDAFDMWCERQGLGT